MFLKNPPPVVAKLPILPIFLSILPFLFYLVIIPGHLLHYETRKNGKINKRSVRSVI